MRTKTLLVAAVAIAAGLASSMAQSNVYSLNVVGYVNRTLAPGFTMVANPLNTTNNTLQGLLPDLPSGSQFLKWNGTTFVVHSKFGPNWAPNASLNPGEGGFANVVAPGFTNTFVGEVLQGSLTNAIPVGFSIQASKVPAAFNLNDASVGLAAALTSGSQVLKWGGAGYTPSTLFGTAFAPNSLIDVAESFFVNTGTATSWVRSFTVQ